MLRRIMPSADPCAVMPNGINLVCRTCRRITNNVVLNQQAREDGRGRPLHCDSSSSCGNAVVLNRKIARRRSGCDNGESRNDRGRSSRRSGSIAGGQNAVGGVFRASRRRGRADIPAGRAAEQIQILDGDVIGLKSPSSY